MFSLLRQTGAAVVALALTAGLALAVSACFFPVTTRALDVVRGERIFQTRCASCHSVAPGGPAGYGPPLYGVADWGGSRIPDMSAEEYVLSSIVDPAAYRAPGSTGVMPQDIARDMEPDELLNVSAYLLTQGGRVRSAALLRLADQYVPRPDAAVEVTRLELASVEKGRELYLGKLGCAVCHPMDSYPGHGLLAPSLLSAGNHRRDFLEESVLQASKVLTPSYETWHLVWNGRPYAGRRLPAPDGTVRLVTADASGTLDVRDFAVAQLEPFDDGQPLVRSGVSTMPAYENAITPQELRAVVDFLCTLR